jgi:hypothetical protein
MKLLKPILRNVKNEIIFRTPRTERKTTPDYHSYIDKIIAMIPIHSDYGLHYDLKAFPNKFLHASLILNKMIEATNNRPYNVIFNSNSIVIINIGVPC